MVLLVVPGSKRGMITLLLCRLTQLDQHPTPAARSRIFRLRTAHTAGLLLLCPATVFLTTTITIALLRPLGPHSLLDSCHRVFSIPMVWARFRNRLTSLKSPAKVVMLTLLARCIRNRMASRLSIHG